MISNKTLWRATKGVVKEPKTFFSGFAAMLGTEGDQVCFVAPDMEALRSTWAKYTDLPLSQEGLMVQEVAIFQKKNVTAEPPQ